MGAIVQKSDFEIGNTRIEIVMQGGFVLREDQKDVSPHRHPNVEVHYIESGELLFSCADTTKRLSTGTLVIIPARLYHAFHGATNGSKRLSFEITVKPKKSGTDTYTDYRHLLSSFDAPLIRNEAIPEMLSLADRKGIIRGEEEICRINAVFTLIFLKICDILRSYQNKEPLPTKNRTAVISGEDTDMTVISILNFIQSHFRSQIRLSDVAKAVSLSERQVQRLLSSKMNDGFQSLLTQHRITAVKTLMASNEEDRSLEALALECGFSNYVSFWKQFKRHTGFTPEEYRANIKKA